MSAEGCPPLWAPVHIICDYGKVREKKGERVYVDSYHHGLIVIPSADLELTQGVELAFTARPSSSGLYSPAGQSNWLADCWDMSTQLFNSQAIIKSVTQFHAIAECRIGDNVMKVFLPGRAHPDIAGVSIGASYDLRRYFSIGDTVTFRAIRQKKATNGCQLRAIECYLCKSAQQRPIPLTTSSVHNATRSAQSVTAGEVLPRFQKQRATSPHQSVRLITGNSPTPGVWQPRTPAPGDPADLSSRENGPDTKIDRRPRSLAGETVDRVAEVVHIETETHSWKTSTSYELQSTGSGVVFLGEFRAVVICSNEREATLFAKECNFLKMFKMDFKLESDYMRRAKPGTWLLCSVVDDRGLIKVLNNPKFMEAPHAFKLEASDSKGCTIEWVGVMCTVMNGMGYIWSEWLGLVFFKSCDSSLTEHSLLTPVIFMANIMTTQLSNSSREDPYGFGSQWTACKVRLLDKDETSALTQPFCSGPIHTKATIIKINSERRHVTLSSAVCGAKILLAGRLLDAAEAQCLATHEQGELAVGSELAVIAVPHKRRLRCVYVYTPVVSHTSPTAAVAKPMANSQSQLNVFRAENLNTDA